MEIPAHHHHNGEPAGTLSYQRFAYANGPLIEKIMKDYDSKRRQKGKVLYAIGYGRLPELHKRRKKHLYQKQNDIY